MNPDGIHANQIAFFHTEGIRIHLMGVKSSSPITTHKLPVTIPARYVRFVPTKQYNWNCLRMEINGNSLTREQQPT